MEIKIKPERIQYKLPQNAYQISMNTYFGDYDGSEVYKIIITPEKLEQTVLEMLFVQYQFEYGRGGCSAMYNQCNYFIQGTIEQSDYFNWLNRYPSHRDYEQNNTLDNFTITYFDENSHEFSVEINETQQLIEDIKKLNHDCHIGEFKYWSSLSADDEMYQDYYQKVIAYIEKYLLEKKVSSEAKLPQKTKI